MNISLLPQCSSCGISLQTESPDEPGYYFDASQAEERAPIVREQETVYEKHMATLLEEDKMLLLNGADAALSPSRTLKKKKEEDDVKPLCLRCRNAHHKSKFDFDEYAVKSVASVMETMPPHANLVYVLSAVDFPMSLNDEVFRYRPASSMQFVVTKNDLMFQKNDLANKYGLQFYQDYLWRTHKVPPEQVFCVSGRADWNTSKLLEATKDDLYFIGSVNSGKSTLIQSLIVCTEKGRDSLPNARRDRKLRKLEDRAISKGFSPQSRQALVKYNLAALHKFKSKQGPGSSYMPGFTRGFLAYDLSKSVTVYDVPGFSGEHKTQMYDFVAPSNMKQLHKGEKAFKRVTFTAHYDTVHSRQALTVGGLFFLQVPKDTIYQIRNCISWGFHVFKSMNKAREVFENPEDYPSLKIWLVEPDSTDLVKYIVPSFYGSIDLVIRYVGHVSITPTGAKKNDDEPLVIYLPRGVDAIIRQPITRYISRTLAGRDANGNPLRKDKWVRQSVTEVKRYTGKTPFYSKLIPVPEDTELSDGEYMKQYVAKAKGTAVDEAEVGPDSQYANWIR